MIFGPYVCSGWGVDQSTRRGVTLAYSRERQGPIPDPVATTTTRLNRREVYRTLWEVVTVENAVNTVICRIRQFIWLYNQNCIYTRLLEPYTRIKICCFSQTEASAGQIPAQIAGYLMADFLYLDTAPSAVVETSKLAVSIGQNNLPVE